MGRAHTHGVWVGNGHGYDKVLIQEQQKITVTHFGRFRSLYVQFLF